MKICIYADDGEVIFEGEQADLKKALVDLDRYRNGLLAILAAIESGVVCDDVAWFSAHETLFDFVERLLHPYEPAAVGDLFEGKR